MQIKRIDGATRIFGAPADWKDDEGGPCHGLAVRDVPTQQGAFMVSAWEPTPAEIEALQRGETLKLWIRGTEHPVVDITVGEI